MILVIKILEDFMKKIIAFLIFTLFISSVFCFGQTPASLKKIIEKELIIQPDPENPFQGTWFFSTTKNMYYIQVIIGMKGTTYFYASRREGWKRQSVYTIEKKGNIYVIPSPLGGDAQVLLDGNLLTLLNITYERYEE